MPCYVDSTENDPGGVVNAFSFTMYSECVIGMQVALVNSSANVERFTFEFSKDGVDYIPVDETNSEINIMVPIGGTMGRSFKFQGDGTFLVTVTASIRTGPSTWNVLSPVDPAPDSIVGPITDKGNVISTPKDWLSPAGAIIAHAHLNILRYAGGSST